MKKILILLFSTSFGVTSTPIIAEEISTHRIENGHIVDDKFSLSSFDMEHFDSILSMSNDEKLEKIIHDGVSGLKKSRF
ncbi:hypothetical protein [Spiroplasma endosymbiont of Labia minor]|uniref:hypothetical protein n=1 Tax=Spiroplasma endosymbiont of Labia minor TaxID=3066305 RepID=UPI0030CB8C81